MALPIYTHILNLKGLPKIFFKLSRPKGNLGGGGVTGLNPKYPRLSSGDTINSGGKNHQHICSCCSFQEIDDMDTESEKPG